MDEFKPALRTAVRIAYRQFDTLTENEREQILAAFLVVGTLEEAEIANKQLYHLREQRKHQLMLSAILEGVGSKERAEG